MLDLKTTLDQLDAVKAAMGRRGTGIDFGAIEALAERRRQLLTQYGELRHAQRSESERMAKLDKKGPEFAELRTRLGEMSGELKALDAARAEVEAELEQRMLYIPNVPQASVPDGKGEEENVEVARQGTPRQFDFEPKAHWDLGTELGILDFDRGAKVAGARFTVLRGAAARLERALINFMLELHTVEHGYTEVLPPFMVNRDAMTGTGQLPKFEADAFKTDNDLFLVPTAEVPVTNLHRDEILDNAELPIAYCAYTPCFRLEAGSHGQDTRGLIRQHQFDKVELVSIVAPEKSVVEHERMTDAAETVLKKLGLPFRTMLLCAGDMGGAARKTYDLEVWLPGQNQYREISSCSNCGDWQARRMNARCRAPGEKQTRFVHTLNGSGLAVGRALIAVMENYQNEDGSIAVPDVLKPYMGGLTKIEKAT